jgi:purine-binding chemotaxis protein CheW
MISSPAQHSNVSSDPIKVVVVKAGSHRVLIPLKHVTETMRPLPIQALRDAPPFVMGMSIVRGEKVPVVDLGSLLGRRESESQLIQRFVSLRLEERSVALAVDAVIQVVAYPGDKLTSLPPLLKHAASGIVESLCLADSELHLLLSSSKLLEASALTEETNAP